MNKIILFFALFSFVSIIFAQENITQYKNVQLPKHEFAFSIGDNLIIRKNNAYMYEWNKFNGLKRIGSYTLSYHFRPVKWVWFGVNYNIIPRYSLRFYYYNVTAYSLAPSIRFSYLNKPKATIYSGLSFGIMVFNNSYSLPDIFYQFTPLGFTISKNKNFFYGGEIGYGFKGYGCIVTGYRF